MAAVEDTENGNEPAWRERAVSRSLNAARSRAEERIQRFMDAAFELVDEKGSTEFTIQEVIDRSGQSLRGFYQYFDGKEELLCALFEEMVAEAIEDLQRVVDAESDPIARLRAFTIRLHHWCDRGEQHQRLGSHNRRPIAEFSMQLSGVQPDRVSAAMSPIAVMLHRLLDEGVAAGAVSVSNTRQATALIQQMVVFTWFGQSVVRNDVTAEQTWEFLLHGLGG